jgi:hypothetical protein
MPIEGINLKNIRIVAQNGDTFQHCRNIKKDNVEIIVRK